MAMLERAVGPSPGNESFAELCGRVWNRRIRINQAADAQVCHLACKPKELPEVWQWLTRDMEFAFASLIVDEVAENDFSFKYVFYRESSPWVYVEFDLDGREEVVPSVVGLHHGPSADWHEREVEDLFGIVFEAHPRLGEFILHEDWPEGTDPMRR